MNKCEKYLNLELLKRNFELMINLMNTLDKIKSENKKVQIVNNPRAFRLNVFDLEDLQKMDDVDLGYETS